MHQSHENGKKRDNLHMNCMFVPEDRQDCQKKKFNDSMIQWFQSGMINPMRKLNSWDRSSKTFKRYIQRPMIDRRSIKAATVINADRLQQQIDQLKSLVYTDSNLEINTQGLGIHTQHWRLFLF